MALAGLIGFILAPLVGESLFNSFWSIEPPTYIGAILVISGLTLLTLSYFLPRLAWLRLGNWGLDPHESENWSRLTRQYFELFDHDLGRPLRRILGKQRELRAIARSSGTELDTPTRELLDEIERQTPSFRLMMSNMQTLIELEAPGNHRRSQPVEPGRLLQRIVDRYNPVAQESGKVVTWWSEPAKLGIVYSDGSAIEHIVTNLIDNAVRFATQQVEVKLTRDQDSFSISVWDDGPGIEDHYHGHIFDREWTPEAARGEERSSSGLGLYIARTLAQRAGGLLTVMSTPAPDSDHHTEFLLNLPAG